MNGEEEREMEEMLLIHYSVMVKVIIFQVRSDLVCVVDATASTDLILNATKEFILNYVEDVHNVPKEKQDRYGVVAFRDPVCHPRSDEDKNDMFQLSNSREHLEFWLKDIKASGGGDDPEDWAGAMDMALHQMKWRHGSKKMILWISDANAHGSRFSGLKDDKFEDQGPRLEGLVQELARRNIYFIAINVQKNNDPGCERTLSEMRRIYDEAGGQKAFVVEHFKFDLTPDDDWFGSDEFPDALQGVFLETLNKSVRGVVGGDGAQNDGNDYYDDED